MKKLSFTKILSSVIAILLAITILAPYLQPLTVYAHPPGTNANPSTQPTVNTQAAQSPPPYKLDPDKQKRIDDTLLKWADEREKEEAEKPTKDKFEKMEKAMEVINQGVPFLIDTIKDIANGGDFDTAALVSGIADLTSGILGCFSPWGKVASLSLGLVKNLVFTFMGGAEGPSELAMMEDHLNQRLDEIADQISEVQDKLNDMSDQINESTMMIIDSISAEIGLSSDKNHLRDFMLSSGTGDFSYNQLRNYIFGTSGDNRNGLTAYYALLCEVQLNGGTSEEIKHYYDLLYSGLVDNRNVFHDYITGDGFDKSIVETYYDVLVSRPDLTEKMGTTAELAAVQFAYDLYQTEMMMDQLILICNNYQYTQMVVNGTTEYNYGTGTVLAKDILNEQSESVIAKSLKVGIDEVRMQFAKDLVNVLCVTNTYMVDQGGEFYYHGTDETAGGNHAYVLEGQILYLNSIPAKVSKQFDLDADAFQYVGAGVDNKYNSIVTIDSTNKNGSVTLTYTETDGTTHNLSSIQFKDATKSESAGGQGTADSPYLISTADQLKNIINDMGAHYRLANDIAFGGQEFEPIGFALNSVDAETYEEFTGVLDGAGHTISFGKIAGKNNTGIFGKIGSSGVVKKLTVSEMTINVSINAAKTTSSTFTGGVIAGINNGTIESCVVEDCALSVTSETDNAGAERTVYFKFGGIAGVNSGKISAAWVKDTRVSVSSTHDFGGADTSANQNNVFVGGICGTCPGTLDYVGVDKDVELNAYAKSVLNPKTTVNPYLKAIVGGITTDDGLEITETAEGDVLKNITNAYSEVPEANLKAERELKVQSGWGKHYGNADAETDILVTKFEDDVLKNSKAESAKDIDEAFAKEESYEVSIVDSTAEYPVGALQLNEDNVEITVNGQEVEDFYVTGLYGFSTYNDDYNNERTVTVLAMFRAVIDGKEIPLSGEFQIKIDKNHVASINVLNYSNVYRKGESAEKTAMIEVVDANGKVTTVNDAAVTVKNEAEVLSEVGTEKELVLSYQGAEYTVLVDVVCDVHSKQFDYSDTKYFVFDEHVDADCQHGGYDAYTCLGCNETVKTNRTGTVNHKRVRDISREATCATPGLIGRVYCEYCETVFEEQVEMPRLAHNIVDNGDPDNHYCTQCEKSYAHDYVVSESLVDGKVTYTYTCYTCGYVGQKQDTNIITNEERLRPAVIVSDGFAKAAGDLVTVYVDIENNPGVNGANFGIRYDERLELVEWYEGEFFANTSTEASHSVSCGYNYIWAAEAANTEKGGNLLKLVFRLPNDAKASDTYDVAVVYSVVSGSVGGFSLPNDVCATLGIPSNLPQKFKTKDGVIRIVDRLPGDLDNNDTVNLVDALYLSNCLVNSTQYPITTEVKQYGDVNLDTLVAVNDVVKILQSLSGGYGASLMAPEYRVQLNTNGYAYDPDALFVQLYGANNTYAALAAIEEEMKQREGYKFLGWYTRLEGGVKIDADSYASQLVAYDQDQKIQTLYAHWEKNFVSFDMNGATSDWIDKETYTGNGEQWIVLQKPTESYTVLFTDPNNSALSKTETMSREFAYWLGSDGVKYYAGDQFPVHKLNMGEIKLTAQWGEWELDYPVLEKVGYDSTQITWYKSAHLLATDVVNEGDFEAIKALTGDVKVLYAKWTAPNTYTVHYDANGGTGTMTDSEYQYDMKGYLKNNAFTKAYDVTFNYGWNGQSNTAVSITHQFKGWSRDGATTLTNDEVYNWTTENGKEITVYAAWDKKTVTLPTPNARTGYTFQGWYMDAAFTKLAGVTGQAGSEFNPTGECTLYAKWKANEYTVLYMTNSATGTITSDQCYTDPYWNSLSSNDTITYGVTGTYLDVPQTDHYTFVGWFTAPVGGTQVADSTGKVTKADFITENNTRIYAHWTPMYSGTYVYDEESLKAITGTGTYHIVKDIALESSWTPLDSFSGVIEGHGHTISNLNFTYTSDSTHNGESRTNYGFVRELKGTIKDVTFNKLTVDIVKYKDGLQDTFVGGVAGYLNGGTISNVKIVDSTIKVDHYREITSSGTFVKADIGGFVGRMISGTVENCSISGSSSVWAKAGYATDEADTECFAGGIVGIQDGGIVKGCSRADSVSVTAVTWANSKTSAARSDSGGITGKTDGGTIVACTSSSSNVSAQIEGDKQANTSHKKMGAISATYTRIAAKGSPKVQRFETITDDYEPWDKYAEDWSMGLSKAELKALGYTKAYITITFWVKEDNDGYQEVYIGTPSAQEIFKKDDIGSSGSWGEHTVTTSALSLDYFGDNMEFKLAWGANGSSDDDWFLGGTTVTFEFTK